MILTDMNINDLSKLQQYRIERLCLFFTSSLLCCQLQINSDNVLLISCLDFGIMSELLDELDDLCNHAWLILGVRAIALCFRQQEILFMDTQRYYSDPF
jgi:hypothetical protein